ncbi:hypothetical protein B0H13DRAFT_1874581 [Mycena leptocephala]|nr:hypothetical protein B0H13DRAFT_1874581 [Mycena leptocephala]
MLNVRRINRLNVGHWSEAQVLRPSDSSIAKEVYNVKSHGWKATPKSYGKSGYKHNYSLAERVCGHCTISKPVLLAKAIIKVVLPLSYLKTKFVVPGLVSLLDMLDHMTTLGPGFTASIVWFTAQLFSAACQPWDKTSTLCVLLQLDCSDRIFYPRGFFGGLEEELGGQNKSFALLTHRSFIIPACRRSVDNHQSNLEIRRHKGPQQL